VFLLPKTKTRNKARICAVYTQKREHTHRAVVVVVVSGHEGEVGGDKILRVQFLQIVVHGNHDTEKSLQSESAIGVRLAGPSTNHQSSAIWRKQQQQKRAQTYFAVILRSNCLASCCCLGVTVRLWVGVDVATNGSASDFRATWVRMGGMAVVVASCLLCLLSCLRCWFLASV
jgi:hypothetical protein